MALNRPQKLYLCGGRDVKQEGRLSPCLTAAANMLVNRRKFFIFPRMSVNNCESAWSIDWGVTNKLQQGGEFANMEPMNDENRLYYIF